MRTLSIRTLDSDSRFGLSLRTLASDLEQAVPDPRCGRGAVRVQELLVVSGSKTLERLAQSKDVAWASTPKSKAKASEFVDEGVLKELAWMLQYREPIINFTALEVQSYNSFTAAEVQPD
eukprot:1391120-Rhodomonas_salina.1